jgi:hypothetical protein
MRVVDEDEQRSRTGIMEQLVGVAAKFIRV